MIKIGFIDYYLDEWHANNYPKLFKEKSDGRYEVCYAYGHIDSPIGGITNKEWAEKNGVQLLDTIEEVVEKSDRIIVLSPDNPEMHELLTDLPLKSGKLVYVDKTFAPDKETAKRIFDNAQNHNTKCFSSSALRFSSELDEIDTSSIYKLYSEGTGTYAMYSIHQIEPIVRLMNCPAEKVMFLGDERHPEMIIKFTDGRYAHMFHRTDPKRTFKITTIDEENFSQDYVIQSDYFGLFIEAVIKFFDTGILPVKPENTIDVIAIRTAGERAIKKPFVWVEV